MGELCQIRDVRVDGGLREVSFILYDGYTHKYYGELYNYDMVRSDLQDRFTIDPDNGLVGTWVEVSDVGANHMRVEILFTSDEYDYMRDNTLNPLSKESQRVNVDGYSNLELYYGSDRSALQRCLRCGVLTYN